MEKSEFFKIDKSVVLLLVLVVILIISIFSLINYRRALILSNNTNTIIAALPARKATPTPTIDPYADWKIYEDSNNGFTFKYPPNLYATLNPNRDGRTLLIISDDNRDTLGAGGWRGIFISVLPNPSKYDSKTYIQWNVKNDPLNAGVKIKKIPITGLDVSMTLGEVVNGNTETENLVYISNGNFIFRFAPDNQTYLNILNKILPTFKFI